MNKLYPISVTGLGYVGLPLAVAFARHTSVVGYDTNEEHVSSLARGLDKNHMTGSEDLQHRNLMFTTDPAHLARAAFHIIAVPTPVDAARQPDVSILFNATRTLARYLKKGDIVVYESTVYPGLTEEECVPILEQESGLQCGSDFFIGYSPERINPGDTEHTLENTIKIIAAQDERTLDMMATTYGAVVKAGLHRIGNIKVAEAAKVIENTQRDINIALMNELALIFEKMQLDTSDVLTAAGTKWNFLRFQPGLVGGHCIGVDPYYLTHKSLRLGYSPRVILSGRSVNDSMGLYVARMVVKQLIKSGKVIKGACITILGLAFKENIPDSRNTRVVDIVRELESFDIKVQIHDPCVDKKEAAQEHQIIIVEREQLERCDAVILAVAHREFVDGGWPFITGLLKDGQGTVFDVKSVLPRELKPDGIILQRL